MLIVVVLRICASLSKMKLLALAGLGSLLTSVLGQSTSVTSYIASESPIAKAGLLANIGPSGAKSSGAKASPSPAKVAPTISSSQLYIRQEL